MPRGGKGPPGGVQSAATGAEPAVARHRPHLADVPAGLGVDGPRQLLELGQVWARLLSHLPKLSPEEPARKIQAMCNFAGGEGGAARHGNVAGTESS